MTDYLLKNGFDQGLVVKYLNTTRRWSGFFWKYRLKNLKRDLETRYSGRRRYGTEERDYNAFNTFLKNRYVRRPAGFQCDLVVPQLSVMQSSHADTLCASKEEYFLQFNLVVFYKFVLWLENNDGDPKQKTYEETIMFRRFIRAVKNSYDENRGNEQWMNRFFKQDIKKYYDYSPRQLRTHYNRFNTFFEYHYIAVSEFASGRLDEKERAKRLGAKHSGNDGLIILRKRCDLFQRF